ncbi:MAG: putative restriction endonuclease-like [Alphaproteobacteria bacterium]|jgi:very-short-patch-repair endonuclease|nr:putative restriction endonuclease-like [Alphaproteobacteria bacterium]
MQPSNWLKKFQKNLRSSQTNAEYLLWYYLRNRNFQGFKFRRQHILQGYIVDFVCLQGKLIIEVDGGQHSEKQDYDDYRTQKLQKDGFQVLRFWNHEVLTNIEGVLEVIMNELQSR